MKILLFALDGMIFDHNFGARYQDAMGTKEALTTLGYQVDVKDNLDGIEPKDYDCVMIIPKNQDLFNTKPGINQIKQSHNDFFDRLRAMDKILAPRVIMLFNDIKIGLHGNYQNHHLFDGINYDCIYAYDECFNTDLELNKEIKRLRDEYIDKEYQSHIKHEYLIDWIVIAYLKYVLSIDDSIDGHHIDKEIHSLYYGNHRPDVIQSLKDMGFGTNKNDYVIGSEDLMKIFNVKGLPIKLPLFQLKDFIRSAQYNLVPYEENKTNKQTTARIIETVVFSHDDAKIVYDKRWTILNELESLSYQDRIRYLNEFYDSELQKLRSVLDEY